jgi:hypothetical protein
MRRTYNRGAAVEAPWRGLILLGTADYDPGCGPSYASGGEPPCLDVDVDGVEIDSWEDISMDLLDYENISSGVCTLLERFHASRSTLLPSLEALLLDRWEDEMAEALAEAYWEER